MSNNRNINTDWEDDDDDLEFEQSFETDTDLVKKLRKANRLQEKKIKDLESNLGSLTKAQRERIIKDTFASKGVNAKIATFVPSDLEASEDAISAWLEEYGDVFGVQTPPKNETSQEDIANLRQMNEVTQNAMSPDKAQDLEMRIANAQSEEELMQILNS